MHLYEKICFHPWSLIPLDFFNNRNLKLLIAYGSLGKFFHLEEFSVALQKQNIEVKLVKDTDTNKISNKVSDKEAEEAFKTILSCLLYTSDAADE